MARDTCSAPQAVTSPLPAPNSSAAFNRRSRNDKNIPHDKALDRLDRLEGVLTLGAGIVGTAATTVAGYAALFGGTGLLAEGAAASEGVTAAAAGGGIMGRLGDDRGWNTDLLRDKEGESRSYSEAYSDHRTSICQEEGYNSWSCGAARNGTPIVAAGHMTADALSDAGEWAGDGAASAFDYLVPW